MASNLLQITSQFTEDCIATIASPCQRCSNIIQPGKKRFYVAPQDQPDKPGRYICERCMDHYLKKPSTTARIGPAATMSSKFCISKIVSHHSVLIFAQLPSPQVQMVLTSMQALVPPELRLI